MIDNRVSPTVPGKAKASPGSPFGRHFSDVSESSFAKIAIDGNAPGAALHAPTEPDQRMAGSLNGNRPRTAP
jgi:hypothetical protein